LSVRDHAFGTAHLIFSKWGDNFMRQRRLLSSDICCSHGAQQHRSLRRTLLLLLLLLLLAIDGTDRQTDERGSPDRCVAPSLHTVRTALTTG